MKLETAIEMSIVEQNALYALKFGTDDYASRVWDEIKPGVAARATKHVETEKYLNEAATADCVGAEICARLGVDVDKPPADVGDESLKQLRSELVALTSVLAGHHARHLTAAIIGDVSTDLGETAGPKYTDGDLKLSVGRVIARRLGLEA